jgi:hypothetical protein
MWRLWAVIGLCSAILGSGLLGGRQAFAAEPANPSSNARRQISLCMTKRMSADRAISYNDAKKACEDRALMGKLALTVDGRPDPGKAH